MKFSEKWGKAYKSRDRDEIRALIHDKFVFIRHQSGKEISKEDMLNFWTSDGPRPEIRNYRIIYEEYSWVRKFLLAELLLVQIIPHI